MLSAVNYCVAEAHRAALRSPPINSGAGAPTMQWKGASCLPSKHKNIVCGYKHPTFHALQTDAEFHGNHRSILATSSFISRESKEERLSLKHISSGTCEV